jgi:SM-20-related protein
MDFPIEDILKDIEEKGWTLQQGLLPATLLQELAFEFQREFLPAKVGPTNQKLRDESIRGDWISWVDPLDPPDRLKKPVDFLQILLQSLNQRFFLGLKQFECHLAKYPENSFYTKHLDRFEKGSTRCFSFIFYLHEEWHPDDGGELVLYDKEKILTSIVPSPGTFVGFLSEEFPHEVKTCYRERRSLTGWMHTKNIY